MRLIDHFDRAADLYPDGHCLHHGTPGWIYKEVRAQTHRAAALLRSPVSKVLKKTLREPHWAGRDRKI
jgi:hypothetical protein